MMEGVINSYTIAHDLYGHINKFIIAQTWRHIFLNILCAITDEEYIETIWGFGFRLA